MRKDADKVKLESSIKVSTVGKVVVRERPKETEDKNFEIIDK